MTKPREEVLYEFALENLQDAGVVDKYLSEYPEFAEDLLELLNEARFPLDEASLLSDQSYEDKNEEAALAAFLACSPKETAKDLFEPFRAGAAFAELAKCVEMPRAVLVAFRDRLVLATSVPAKKIATIAVKLNASVEEFLAYLALPSRELGILRFKAAEKPAIQEKRTYREIVMGTDMSDEQRELLLKD